MSNKPEVPPTDAEVAQQLENASPVGKMNSVGVALPVWGIHVSFHKGNMELLLRHDLARNLLAALVLKLEQLDAEAAGATEHPNFVGPLFDPTKLH